MKTAAAIAVLVTFACAAPGLGASVPLKAEDGRFTMEVEINGQAQRFVVDTAAPSTFMAAEAATALGLTVNHDPQSGDTVQVASYESPLFRRANETISVVPRTGMSVADGVVGMDLFAAQRVTYDFTHLTFTVDASAPPLATVTTIPVELTAGTLAVVDAVIDGVKVKALIDGGARHTIGNPLLQKALGLADGDPRLSEDHPVPGPTAPPAVKATVGGIDIGAIHIDKPVVAFSALGFFKAVGLDGTPALLLGSDLQRRFKTVTIDYVRHELQLRQ